MTPGKTAYLMALATLLALCLVWQSASLRNVGYRIESLRRETAEQRDQAVAYRAQLSRLKSPRRILGLVDWLGLQLAEPEPALVDAPAPGADATPPAVSTTRTDTAFTVAEGALDTNP
jgi:hypothetical protein